MSKPDCPDTIAIPRLEPKEDCPTCAAGPCGLHTGFLILKYRFSAVCPGRLPGGKNQVRLIQPKKGKPRKVGKAGGYFARWIRYARVAVASAAYLASGKWRPDDEPMRPLLGEVALRVSYDGAKTTLHFYSSDEPYRKRQHASDLDAQVGALGAALEQANVIRDDGQIRHVDFTTSPALAPQPAQERRTASRRSPG